MADLSLDTYIYNGGATTAHALFMGVPVITLQGKTYISRMSSSLLTNIGLPELITHSLKEYETLAVELAKNPEKLKRIKSKIRINKGKYPLFDTSRFVKNLETAYQKMWEIYLQGKDPHSVSI